MKFPNCPWCFKKWVLNKVYEKTYTHDCVSCNVRYIPEDELLTKRDFLGRPNYHLGWDFLDNTCFYGSLEEKVSGGGVELPLLPLDISPEKLKLYLLFS